MTFREFEILAFAKRNAEAVAVANSVAEQVNGYKGAEVVGVRGMEYDDARGAVTFIRSDVIWRAAPGEKMQQTCVSWVGSVDESKALQLRRWIRNRISRALTKAARGGASRH